MSKVGDLNQDSIGQVDSGSHVVDFWAPWCGPCKAQAPIIDAASDELAAAGSPVRVSKVNVDENPDLAKRFGIRSIPCILAIKDGSVVGTGVGLQQKKAVMDLAAKANGIDEKTTDAVLHAILAHHMSREAGSPVAPKTREAWILTLCDNLSARMDDADTWDVLGRRTDKP